MDQQATTRNRIESEGIRRRFFRHAGELGRLAPPIVLSRAGFLILVLVDTAMVGHFNSRELAFLSLGFGLVMPMSVAGLGLIMGTLVLSANNFGAGRLAECGAIWRRSLVYSACIGAAFAGIGLLGPEIMLLTGQEPDLAAGGGHVMSILALGLPGQLLFLSSAYFLEGIGRPTPVMVVMIFANILNAVFNWLLIDGPLAGAPLGAAGAAMATSAVRWLMAISLFAVVWTMRDRERFAVRTRPAGGFAAWRELRRIGYAIGLSVGVEAVAFAALNVFAGWLGEMPLATYGLALNLVALTFMLSVGVGAATSVRVGIAHGRGDAPDATLAGWTGFVVNTILMLGIAVAIRAWPDGITGIYTADAALIAFAAPVVAFCGLIVPLDGGQAVMSNALRGRKDVWGPSVIQTASFFVVMLPIAYASAFTFENGIMGIFHGIAVGCTASLLALASRFQVLSHRDRKS